MNNVESHMNKSQQYLEQVDTELKNLNLEGIYFKKPGSMYIADTQEEEKSYQAGQQYLTTLGRTFEKADIASANHYFGTHLPEDVSAYIKEQDHCFLPNALDNVRRAIIRLGGEVVSWQCVAIHLGDSHEKVVEFKDPSTQETRFIPAAYLHTSLGATEFSQRQTAMTSAVGVSCQVIIQGELFAPVVLGGSNHLSPNSLPQNIDGKTYTLATLTAAAQIAPRNPAPSDRNRFIDKDALAALAHLNKYFGNSPMLINVNACWRIFSAANFPEEGPLKFNGEHVEDTRISQAWGGCGLGASGYPGQIFAERHAVNNIFSSKLDRQYTKSPMA